MADDQLGAPNSPQDDLDERESDFRLNKDTRFVIFRPNDPLMAKPELRQIDRQPQRIFFYKNLQTDEIFQYTEAEAARMMTSSWAVILRQIGVSDGTAYRNSIKNCGVKVGERIPLERAQQILRDAFNAELEAAKGHYAEPEPQNVHFDNSFKTEAQRRAFTPPA